MADAPLPKRSQAAQVPQQPPPAVGTTGARGAQLPTTPPRDVAEPGTTAEVTWGEELFQPVQYNAFRVGPFKAVAVVRPGESVADAVYRVWLDLNAVAMRIRDEKMTEYLRALEEAVGQANKRR